MGTALNTEPSGDRKKEGVVRPESTVESANARCFAGNPPAIAGSSNVGCESTVDSARRRTLIKGAGLLAVAAVAGGLALGLNGARRANANCNFNITAGGKCATFCNVRVQCSILVDANGGNSGKILPGIAFGPVGSAGCVSVGISSGTPQNISAGAPPGLCFFTGGQRRLGIAQAGCVSIGTPLSTAVSTLNAGAPTLRVNSIRGCGVAVAACSQAAPGIVATSCISVGVKGITRASCITISAICGVADRPGGGCILGSGIGVRGISGNGFGVLGGSGNFCINALAPCIRGPQGPSVGVAGISGRGAGVAGISCLSNGVLGTSHAPSVCSTSGSAPLSSIPAGVLGKSVLLCTNEAPGPGIGVRGLSGSGPGALGSSCVSSGVIGLNGNLGKVSLGCIPAAGVVGGSLSKNTGCVITRGCATGVRGFSGGGAGVVGCSTAGPGIQAHSQSGVGSCITSCIPLVGNFRNGSRAPNADQSSLIQFQAGCISLNGPPSSQFAWVAGVSGQNNSCRLPAGAFYLRNRYRVIHAGQFGAAACVARPPSFIIGSCGAVGIGTSSPHGVCLQVGGSIAARALAVSGNTTSGGYSMSAQCFAVLADSSSLPPGANAFKVTLPSAGTAQGMMVLVKKTDSSKHSVTVSAGSGDQIEGADTRTLNNQFDALQLISDGSHTWYIIGSEGKGS